MKRIVCLFILVLFGRGAYSQLPFTPIDTNFGTKTVILPTGWQYSALFGAGDSIVLGNGTKQTSKDNQDLCVYVPKKGSSTEGYLFVSHEKSNADAVRGDGGQATILEVSKINHEWVNVGPKRKVDFTGVGGTWTNCSGFLSPKGTVFTAEEFPPDYNAALVGWSDTTDFGGYKRYLNYGWMVEVDPVTNTVLGKRFHMGRFSHEGGLAMADGKTIYLTDDFTPGGFFKFVATKKDDYSDGQLYAYKQSADGLSGSWITLPMNRDSLNKIRDVAFRMGATMFFRLEDIDLAPDGTILICETGADLANFNSSATMGGILAKHLESRRVGVTNTAIDSFGRMLRFNPSTNKVWSWLEGGTGPNGTHFSNPDNIEVDTKRNYLVINEDLISNTGGRSKRNFINEIYYVDLSITSPTTADMKRFMVAPDGSETTGGFFTPDMETYFVNIQHPNATDINPFNRAQTIACFPTYIKTKAYELKSSPLIGTYDGVSIYYGGFSGLDAIPGEPNGFTSVSDRGPNADADALNGGSAAVFFPFPDFSPVIYDLRTEGDSIRIVSMTNLKRPDGSDATGLPPTPATGNPAETYWDDLVNKTAAGPDNFGIDAEGIVPSYDDDYLICDEYGPTVWSVNKSDGELQLRYTPYTIEGPEVLFDSVYKRRRANRGFEGIALEPRGRFLAMLQSPAYNPNGSAGDASQIHRMLEMDLNNNKSKTFAYLHQPKTPNIREKDWKIGDMTAINDHEFLVIEHAVRNGEDSKKIYKININKATDITSDNFGGKTLEQLINAAGLEANDIEPVEKTFFIDLLANGYDPVLDKPEGLTIINDSMIAVCNDNDFGIVSPDVDGEIVATGRPSRIYVFTLPPDRRLKNYVRNTHRNAMPNPYSGDATSNDEAVAAGVAVSDNGVILGEAYPNPAANSVTFDYTLPQAMDIKLEIFTLEGKYVATVIADYVGTGKHSITWDASKLSNGSYVYSMKAGKTSIQKIIQIVK